MLDGLTLACSPAFVESFVTVKEQIMAYAAS